MSSGGMISAICWVPKGAAKPVPEAAPISEEEMAAMRKEAEDVAAGVLEQSEEEEDSDEWETEDEEMDEQEAIAKAKAVAAAVAANKSGSSAAGSGKKVR